MVSTGESETVEADRQQKTEDEKTIENSKLISTEHLKTGSVGYKVYYDYMKAIGILGTFITIFSYIAANGFAVGYQLWLSEWTSDSHKNSSNTVTTSERLEVYAALGLGQTIFILIATITLNLACLRGSSILHELMLENVIRLPMSFFDTTPIGLNKSFIIISQYI